MEIALLEKWLSESNPSSLIQSLVIFYIVWAKVRPHLTRIENEIAQININMSAGFSAGETRFQKLESRVEKIENIRGSENGLLA
jgi:hypothetical protein